MKTLFATNLTNHKTSKPELTIMSFNIRLFNQYDWIKTEGINDSIFKYLQDESPDIIAFQEFINHTKSDLNYINQMKELGYPYYSLEPKTQAAKEKKYFGLATFSKHKISSSGVAYQNFTPKGYPSKTVSIFSDIQINKNIVRVYNTHLKSLSFGKNDYEFVENITGNTKDDAVKKSKGIASKVLQAAYKRANEIKAINQHVSESPYPVILLGDFNEPPYTYSYKQATTNLSDSFLEHGFGLGTTYDGISTIPGLRLDFILHSPALICTSFEIGMSGLSDHRPLIAGFSFSE